jgi:hypothetical protein
MKFAELHANGVSTEFPDFSCRQVVQLCLIYTIEPSKKFSSRASIDKDRSGRS